MMGATVFKSAATTTANSCGRGDEGHRETKMPALAVYRPTASGAETRRRTRDKTGREGDEVTLPFVI